jgi:hypothetical protein
VRSREFGLRPERQPDVQGQREILTDIDDRLPGVGPGDRHHALTGRNDLPDLCTNRDDDTGEIGFELGITELLDGLGQIGLRPCNRCLGTGAGLLGIVQCLLCGRIGPDQSPLPLLRGSCIGKLRVRLGQFRLGCAHGKLERRRIDRSDGLSFRDEVSNIDGARREASQDPERQTGLEPGLNDTHGNGAIRAARLQDCR